MTHAEHSSELRLAQPATGKDETHVGGEPCGFVIEFENGFRIWHTGDTGLFGDMQLIGEHEQARSAAVPIGGGQFVMNPADAAMATRDLIKPRNGDPDALRHHPRLSGTPEEYIKALGSSPVKVFNIKPGEALIF